MVRSPRQSFEWLLFFSPALIMIAGGVLAAGLHIGEQTSILLSAGMLGFGLSMISASRLAKPRESRLEEAIATIFATLGIFILNAAVAFPGCLVIGHLSEPST